MQNTINITEASKALFIAYAKDATLISILKPGMLHAANAQKSKKLSKSWKHDKNTSHTSTI